MDLLAAAMTSNNMSTVYNNKKYKRSEGQVTDDAVSHQ